MNKMKKDINKSSEIKKSAIKKFEKSKVVNTNAVIGGAGPWRDLKTEMGLD